MSCVNVLDFVARELKGRIVTVSSLSAFIAAEKAADRLAMAATSREAAQLAVLMPNAPLERICREFGSETADIVEALRPTSPYSRIAIEAMAVHGRSQDDEVRRDAAIAACAAEAAVARPEDYERMTELFDSMADRETEPACSAFLKELREQLPGPGSADLEGGSRGRIRVISISMDVCGSTEAKTRMRATARNDKELAQWYKEFHHQFLSSECRFYSLLFRHGHGGINLDWKHAFVVKGIGDEIWLLYEVGEDDLWKLRSLVARLFHAALEVAKRPIHWTSATDDHDLASERSLETRHLPLKFYIDILDDAFEVSAPRRDFVTERLPEILGPEENQNSGDFIELGNRLHAGNLMGDGRRLVTAIRTDYIGWEVDRFFRATKFALPSVITVGRALFEDTFHAPRDSDGSLDGTGLQMAVVECPIQQGASTRYDHSFRYVKKDIKPEKLKGVDEGYTVYRVLRENDLLGLRHTGADHAIMEDTFNVFTPEMERAERDRRRR